MAYLSLQNQLKKYTEKNDTLSMKIKNVIAFEDLLTKEAEKLIEILEDEIDKAIYLQKTISQSGNAWYKRTDDLKNSINKNVVVDPKTKTITIGFIPELAWHDSWITKRWKPDYERKGYVPMLVNEGFRILYANGKRYEGTGFLENAMDRYSKCKHPVISAKLEKPKKWW